MNLTDMNQLNSYEAEYLILVIILITCPYVSRIKWLSDNCVEHSH